MPAIRRPISSLVNGISQRPPSSRHPSQAAIQVNGHSSLAEGLQKRAPTQNLAKISTSAYNAVHTHVINWNATDQFIVVITDGDLAVFDFDGNSKTVNFPDGKTYLAAVTDASTDFATVMIGDTLYVANKVTTVAKTAAVAGGTAKGEVQDFASLPTSGMVDGDVYQIVGDDTLFVPGYYMKWDNTNLVWKECAEVGITTTLDPSTMPMKLTYNSGTGQFTLAEETWDIRGAGDATSLPDPSFVGLTIRDLVFYRNRLGIIAGEHMSFSRSGPDFNNFFYQSGNTTLATDPINLRAANVNVAALNSAVTLNKQLVTFADKTQFVLSTAVGAVFTGDSGSLDVSTTYSANAVAKPLSSGKSVYFASEDTLFARLREYAVSSSNEILNSADDMTAHVQQYIPAGVFKMAVVEDEDIMFLLSSGDTSRLYVYNYFWLDEERLQSAWSHWQFDDTDDILSVEALDSSLYLVIQRGTDVFLERIDLTDDPSLSDLGFTCLLDKRVSLTGVYSSGTGITTWTLPYAHSGLTIEVVKGGSWTDSYGAAITVSGQTGTVSVEATGDYSAYPCYLGVPYTFQYRFSEQFVRKAAENDAGSAVLNGHLQLRQWRVKFSDTGYIRAEVVPRDGHAGYTYVYSGRTLGAADLIIGQPTISSGVFRFPVFASSENAQIDLINDTHMPCNLVSAEWTGTFNQRAGD